jgi:hypothetical protein
VTCPTGLPAKGHVRRRAIILGLKQQMARATTALRHQQKPDACLWPIATFSCDAELGRNQDITGIN